MSAKKTWILKTRGGGSDKDDQWPKFLEESVIACGWRNLPDPSRYLTLEMYREGAANLRASWGPSFNHATKTAYEFCHSIQSGDTIVISRGYNKESKTVRLYGIAVAGRFRFEPQSWWSFKRHAAINRIDVELDRSIFAAALGLQTLMQTLHGPFDNDVVDKLTAATGSQSAKSDRNSDHLSKSDNRKLLKRGLSKGFGIAEIRSLCFDSDIADFENLIGDGLEQKIESLILYCEKRGSIKQLRDEIEQARPGLISSLQD